MGSLHLRILPSVCALGWTIRQKERYLHKRNCSPQNKFALRESPKQVCFKGINLTHVDMDVMHSTRLWRTHVLYCRYCSFYTRVQKVMKTLIPISETWPHITNHFILLRVFNSCPNSENSLSGKWSL